MTVAIHLVHHVRHISENELMAMGYKPVRDPMTGTPGFTSCSDCALMMLNHSCKSESTKSNLKIVMPCYRESYTNKTTFKVSNEQYWVALTKFMELMNEIQLRCDTEDAIRNAHL